MSRTLKHSEVAIGRGEMPAELLVAIVPQPSWSSASLDYKTQMGWQKGSWDKGTCHHTTIPSIPHGKRANSPKSALHIPWHTHTYTIDVIKNIGVLDDFEDDYWVRWNGCSRTGHFSTPSLNIQFP